MQCTLGAVGLALVFLWGAVERGDAIDCFECYSLAGSRRDCEDEFGPHNKTAHLIRRSCKVGYLDFKAHYCVKIKGVKENGQHIIIRTCAVDDWGTQCGDLLFEQGDKLEPITGCLATCDYDGCNTGSHLLSPPNQLCTIFLCFIALLCVHDWLSSPLENRT